MNFTSSVYAVRLYERHKSLVTSILRCDSPCASLICVGTCIEQDWTTTRVTTNETNMKSIHSDIHFFNCLRETEYYTMFKNSLRVNFNFMWYLLYPLAELQFTIAATLPWFFRWIFYYIFILNYAGIRETWRCFKAKNSSFSITKFTKSTSFDWIRINIFTTTHADKLELWKKRSKIIKHSFWMVATVSCTARLIFTLMIWIEISITPIKFCSNNTRICV